MPSIILGGYDLGGGGFGHAQQAHLGARSAGGVAGDLGHAVIGAIGRIEDDGELDGGHADNSLCVKFYLERQMDLRPTVLNSAPPQASCSILHS